MPLGPFLLYTTLGAAAWNSVLALLGYIIFRSMGGNMTTAEVAEAATKYSHEIGYVILALAVVVVGILIYKGVKPPKKQA